MTDSPAATASLPRWKLLLFWAILVGLVALVLEGTSRLYLKLFRGFDGQHLLEYEFDPYKNILPTRNYRDTRGIQHNSVGFRRSSEVSIEKPAGTYRIFIMGGSTAYGVGGQWTHLQREFQVIRNEQTIDANLQKELNAALPGRKIEVINAAITSTWSHHHLIYLNQTILKYRPDMVIFIDGFNDYYFVDKGHDQFASYAYQEQSNGIMGDPTIASLIQANAWWFYRKSAFGYVTIRALRDLKTAVKTMISRATRPAMVVPDALAGLHDVFPRNALKMVERNVMLVRNEGATPVLVLQPMLILERDRSGMPEIEKKLFDFDVQSLLPNYESFIHQAVPWVSDTARKVVEGKGGVFMDATGIFHDAQGQIFTDYVHLTPHANELVAHFIAGRILPIISGAATPSTPGPTSPRTSVARPVR
jgi:lysophospholipase L1-like esterase